MTNEVFKQWDVYIHANTNHGEYCGAYLFISDNPTRSRYNFFDDYDINASGAIEIGRSGAPLHFSSVSTTVFDPAANTDAILDDTTDFAPNFKYTYPSFSTAQFFDSSIPKTLSWYHYYVSTTSIY